MKECMKKLDKLYKGRKLINGYEEIGKDLLEKHGMEMGYGDHQIMVRVVSYKMYDGEEWKGLDIIEKLPEVGNRIKRLAYLMQRCKYEAYACIVCKEPEEEVIMSIHMEHRFTCIKNKKQYDDLMTDAEYEKITEVMKELLDAITECGGMQTCQQ